MTGVELFISDLKALCKENNITLKLPKTKHVKYDSFRLSGYFDESTLAAAMGNPDAVHILIHESCHLDQFLEKSSLWQSSVKNIDIDSWLEGKEFDYLAVEKSLNSSKLLELDCEKRAVKKFKKYKIPFNKKEYIKKANAYVQFYNYLKLSRKWCKKDNTPYTNENVWKEMPDRFMRKKWYDEMEPQHLALFIQNKI